MKLIKSIIYGINIIVVVFTLLAYIAPYVNPAHFWIFSFFGLGFTFLLILNVLFIIYYFIYNWKRSLLSIIVLIVGFNHIGEVISFNTNKASPKNSGAITVMSYNVNQGSYLYKKRIKKYRLSRFLNSQSPDILLLQEKNSKRINQELDSLINYKFYYTLGNKGVAIFSKFKIIDKGEIDFNTNTNSCLWADLVIGNDTVRVYSVHFESNQISKPTAELVSDIEKDQTIQSKNIRSILSRYKTFVKYRAKQVDKVKAHIKKSPFMVIIGGDFNDPPLSYTYRQFSDLLQDAFKEKGLGFGITYAGQIPLLRIDYIMASRGIDIIDFHRIKRKYSDHFPIMTKLSFSTKSNPK